MCHANVQRSELRSFAFADPPVDSVRRAVDAWTRASVSDQDRRIPLIDPKAAAALHEEIDDLPPEVQVEAIKAQHHLNYAEHSIQPYFKEWKLSCEFVSKAVSLSTFYTGQPRQKGQTQPSSITGPAGTEVQSFLPYHPFTAKFTKVFVQSDRLHHVIPGPVFRKWNGLPPPTDEGGSEFKLHRDANVKAAGCSSAWVQAELPEITDPFSCFSRLCMSTPSYRIHRLLAERADINVVLAEYEAEQLVRESCSQPNAFAVHACYPFVAVLRCTVEGCFGAI